MNCPKCGGELETIYPDGIGKFGCPICKMTENELLPIALAQKEKAESALKAIREVITRYEDGSCLQKCEKYCSDCLAKEIIKQIGGVK